MSGLDRASGLGHGLRSPPLTANRIEDLDEVVAVAMDNIRYLNDAIECALHNASLVERFKQKRDRLQRGHDYLVGLLAAERSRRQ